MTPTPEFLFLQLLQKDLPDATAWIRGDDAHSDLSGLVKFYSTSYGGVLVEAEVFNLPNIATFNSTNFYAMHIHQNGDCSAHFTKTGEHYNPTGAPHPAHVGDLLPLLGNQGYAFSIFYDKRFQISEIIGRSLVIHQNRDDFTSQPAGDSGSKIGCGIIRRTT